MGSEERFRHDPEPAQDRGPFRGEAESLPLPQSFPDRLFRAPRMRTHYRDGRAWRSPKAHGLLRMFDIGPIAEGQ